MPIKARLFAVMALAYVTVVSSALADGASDPFTVNPASTD
jgi:hypothetical protein